MTSPILPFFSRLFSNSGITFSSMKVTFFALILMLTVGCGASIKQPVDSPAPKVTPTPAPSPSPTPTPSITAVQVFTNIAETWSFQDGFGNLLWIDVQPQPDGSTIWHYHKNATQAYWMPGGEQAELYFFLAQDSTGAWYSTGGHIIAPFGYPWETTPVPHDFTYGVAGVPGHPRPYMILADSGTTDDTVFPDEGSDTARWTTKMYVENGELISEQWEGVCGHEKWHFQIGRGLIMIEPLDQGSCVDVDPRLNMVRNN